MIKVPQSPSHPLAKPTTPQTNQKKDPRIRKYVIQTFVTCLHDLLIKNLVNRFQMLVGTSTIIPDDIPNGGYSAPELCHVPATPSLTRTQLKMKNELWPTIFSPHLLPKEIQFSREEVTKIVEGVKMAVEEARRAFDLGEVLHFMLVILESLPIPFTSLPLASHSGLLTSRRISIYAFSCT